MIHHHRHKSSDVPEGKFLVRGCGAQHANRKQPGSILRACATATPIKSAKAVRLVASRPDLGAGSYPLLIPPLLPETTLHSARPRQRVCSRLRADLRRAPFLCRAKNAATITVSRALPFVLPSCTRAQENNFIEENVQLVRQRDQCQLDCLVVRLAWWSRSTKFEFGADEDIEPRRAGTLGQHSSAQLPRNMVGTNK